MAEHEDKAMSTHTLPTRSANEGLVVSPADAGVAPGGAPPRGAGADAGASDGAALFEAFWAIYPRKEGRAVARKAFDAAMARGVSVETLIDGARRYAAAKAHADPNWLKFPATWLRDECWLEDPQPPRRKEPKPERAPKANGNAAPDRAPGASKANGKAEPPAGSLDETEPFEIFEDDDGWSDDPERIQPEAIEMGFSRDRCVRLKSNGRKGQVLGAVMGDDPRVVDKCLWVTVCWKSTPMSMVSELDLELENPTPEERVATAAAAEKRAKRLAEQVRRRDEVPKRFPIGARVQRRSDGRTGKVIKIDLDALLLDVMWDDIRDRDCHLIRKSSGSQISWMSDDEIERVRHEQPQAHHRRHAA